MKYRTCLFIAFAAVSATTLASGAKQAILRERVLKPNEEGSPRVSYETVSLVGTGSGTVPCSLPPMTTNVTANALGNDFIFTLGQVDFLYFMLASAATSPEKQVKAGDEFPIKWASTKQSFSVEGKGKILSVGSKEVREDITLNMTFEGKPLGTIHWVSTISTLNYSLLWSQGTWAIQNIVTTDMTISRKAPSGS